MRSPDIFADDDDSDDSFEKFVATPLRRRSRAIIAADQESFDAISGSSQITVIENLAGETILEEHDVTDKDDTLTRMLESSDEEDQNAEETGDDALSNLLKSFREPREEGEEEDSASDVSMDVFGGSVDDDQEEGDEEGDVTMLPVEIPIRKDTIEPPVPKRSRMETPVECVPSTSNGPDVVVCSDPGDNRYQPQTIQVHGQTFEVNSYTDYMRMKITKLNHQVNSQKSKPFEKLSDLFKGFSVFVNGYTEPPALVIRDLMISHGGEYHCYYMHGRTSYVIASSIATAKIDKIREKEIFIKADWITESITAGRPLDYRDFLIYEKGAQEKGQMRQFLTSKSPETANSGFLDARNPNFIRDYYARSRLHLISTLAQDMKDFVANLKMEGKLTKKCFDEDELKDMKSESNGKKSNVFHVDLDCFFVSVAVRDREDLKDKEVAITHSKGTISNSMSEVASCSYAARSCGVKNGMLVRDALQKCPQLTLLPYQFDDYVDVSRQIYQILASYTLELRAVSCDEMYINVTSICEEHGIDDPVLLAEHMRRVIRKETRCPASVGIGPNSLLARLATRHAKPDGVYWVTDEKRDGFMAGERVRDLPGLGYQMMERLTACLGDISTCSQLQKFSERDLTPVFGPKLATKIYRQCRGTEEDSDEFWKTQLRKSVSCDINYGIRFSKRDEMVQLMRAIGTELERKLTDCKMSAGSITLKLMVRSADAPLQTAKFMGHGMCDTYTKTANLSVPTIRGETITAESLKLYAKINPKVEDLRGVGVTCGKLKSKMRSNVVNAVQKMFGMMKDEAPISNDQNKRQTHTREDSPEEEEREMRHRVTDPEAVGTDKKLKIYQHPKDLHPTKGVSVPGILMKTEVQLRRALKKATLSDDFEKTVENMVREGLLREPTERSVREVQMSLKALLKTGKLSTFERCLQHFEQISMDSKKSHLDWFPAFHIMLQNLKNESKELLVFPIESTEKRVKKPEDTKKKQEKESVNRERFVPREVIVFDTTNL